MRRTVMVMVALAWLMIAAPRVADARAGAWFGLPGASIFAGPPAPPVAVVPRPYYYAPPAYYAPPPVVVAPRYWGRPYPYYAYGPRYRGWRGPPGWYKHGHKHGHKHGWYKHGRW